LPVIPSGRHPYTYIPLDAHPEVRPTFAPLVLEPGHTLQKFRPGELVTDSLILSPKTSARSSKTCHYHHPFPPYPPQSQIEPALAWAQEHQFELEARGSPLPFLLARLAFVSRLQRGELNLALQIARNELMPLALRASATRLVPSTTCGRLPMCHGVAPSGYAAQSRPSTPETKFGASAVCKHSNGCGGSDAAQVGGFSVGGVRQLMGALAFAPALRGSPYEWLIQPRMIDEACEVRRLGVGVVGLPHFERGSFQGQGLVGLGFPYEWLIQPRMIVEACEVRMLEGLPIHPPSSLVNPGEPGFDRT
jgi:hypothetical protein